MNSVPAFEDELKRVESTDARQIIVDLSGLNSIGSDGLKALINANTRSRRDGNRLILVHGPKQVQKTFERTGLLAPLPFANENELRSLYPGHVSPALLHFSKQSTAA